MASPAAVATAVNGVVTTRTVFSRLREIPIKYPLAFGVAFSGCKTSFSDLLVQKVVERREQVDWKRNAAFAAFGFLYLGGVQYTLYVPIFSRVFPRAASFAQAPIRQKLRDINGMFQCAAQVFLDQCIHHPFMYFPAFYCTRELVMQDKPDLTRCLQDYRRNMTEDLHALWKIWVPATFLNFAFMPMYARIPFVASVSLVWTCVLSTMRGGDVGHAEEMAGGAITGATLHMMEEVFHDRNVGLFTEPVKLDADKAHIVLTASGRDKPGWVALLSRAVTNAGGSVTESKMVRLGDEFIILMHVSIPPEQAKGLLKTVKKTESLKPLSVQSKTIARRDTGSFEPPKTGVRLICVGENKPGLLASIAESLFQKGLSVEHVHTSLRRRTTDKSRVDFVCEADCVTTSFLDEEEIQVLVQDLTDLKHVHNLDTCDIRVQRLRIEDDD